MGLRSKHRKRAVVRMKRALMNIAGYTGRYFNDTRMISINLTAKQGIKIT